MLRSRHCCRLFTQPLPPVLPVCLTLEAEPYFSSDMLHDSKGFALLVICHHITRWKVDSRAEASPALQDYVNAVATCLPEIAGNLEARHRLHRMVIESSLLMGCKAFGNPRVCIPSLTHTHTHTHTHPPIKVCIRRQAVCSTWNSPEQTLVDAA